MTPNHQHTAANACMLAGIVPLLAGLGWTLSSLSALHPDDKGQVAALFMVFGRVALAYGFAVMISGASAWWSLRIEKRYPRTRTGAARAIRILIGIVLIVPLALRFF